MEDYAILRRSEAASIDHDGVRAALGPADARQNVGRHIVPIVPDEARTFGMESLFRQFGIYAHAGQLYEPVDPTRCSTTRSDDGRFWRRSPRRLDVVVHRRRQLPFEPRHQHDPVFHLLLDFGFQRMATCFGRPATCAAGASCWRHRRTDHLGRRRAATSGRQQPSERLGLSNASLRPVFRLRDGRDRAGRPAADVLRRGESTITSR